MKVFPGVRLAWLPLAIAFVVSCGGGGGGGGGGGDGGGDGSDAAAPPDASAPDAGDVDGPGPADAGTDAAPVMSIISIFPSAASRAVETSLRVTGAYLATGATLRLSNCDTATSYDLTPSVQVAADGLSLTASLAADPLREQGLYTVTVANPDGASDALECAFRVLAAAPPTVTDVVPASSYRGVAGDGVNSDTTISIVGTGFQSTPTVRWVSTDGSRSYDALFVGYGSSTQLTAVVPSETLGMAAGQYHVFITNPDLLTAQWRVVDQATLVPGVFTVTTNAPPDIVDVSPARIENGSCTSTSLTISGRGFAVGATVWYVAPAGTTCAGSIRDANGATLCPLIVDAVAAGSTITAHLGTCPGQGSYPLVVINPDGQSDYFFSIEITPSSAGHLNTGPFITQANALQVARWKHAVAFGFDTFGRSHLYVAGGQDASGVALGSVEASELDIFGTPGAFRMLEQYGSPTNPRVRNQLNVPRQGLTMVRLGRDLFAAGGATLATDVSSVIPASAEVEHARILSYDEMPAIRTPRANPGAGLPVGSWYYRVSAIGPWGESLASTETVVLNRGGQIEVCWNPPALPGATAYHVYRSLSADGRAGTASALAYELTGSCLTDDGAGPLTPAPSAVRGTITTGGALAVTDHSYRVSATVALAGGVLFETYAGYASTVAVTAADVGAGNASVTLAWNPIPNATYSVFKLDPGTGRYRLLAGAGAVTATTLIDGGLAFDASDRGPRAQVTPLAPGSLSRWDANTVPALTVAREGLDGVAIAMDPMTSGNLIGRILVAGGRSSNASGSGAYLRTAESLGVYADGTFDVTWSIETPQFTSARAYFALLTTQGRNETPFPPPPSEPPCGDLDGDGAVSCNCAAPGTPNSQLDCNDADPTVHPGATEICGDGIDQDCDQGCTGTDLACTCTTDADLDGHVSTAACGGDDCCDTGLETTTLGCAAGTAGGIHPGVVDICGDGIDQDCDGIDRACTCATDADGDGHVAIACGGADCCDVGTDVSLGCTDATDQGIHPGAAEICGNGVDDDCVGGDEQCPIPAWSPPTARIRSSPMTELRDDVLAPPTLPPMGPVFNVVGSEPIYLVAVAGDDQLDLAGNQGRQDYEACLVDPVTGRLVGTTWVTQTNNDTQRNYGADATLYFSYLYPFYGVGRETVATVPSTRSLLSSAIGRHPVTSLTTAAGSQIIGSRQSASTSFEVRRGYYQMVRLLSYVYVIGGWSEAAAAPIGTIERHQQ